MVEEDKEVEDLEGKRVRAMTFESAEHDPEPVEGIISTHYVETFDYTQFLVDGKTPVDPATIEVL